MTKDEIKKLAEQAKVDEISDDELDSVAGGATREQLMESFAKKKNGLDCPYFGK